ncbi:hypothetical protein [Tenacibaculum sp. 190524A02b]|uniref:hypothetical protein n=1 Tax=Tenacibaculum vairaonense TaxID=3137860 RepID=UPI0031FB327A
MSTETVTIENVSSNIIFQQDKAQIDMQIATAKQYPRNITRATENAIAIVTMSKETAESCNYIVPRAGKAIAGPSVHLARILAQQWGNMRIDAKVTSILEKQIVSEAIAFDLENNLAVKIEVRKSIVNKYGKRYSEDMITVTGNAANATALRNAIFNVIPKSVTQKTYEAAKKTITGDLSTEEKLIKKRTQVLNGLKDHYKVTEEDVLKTIGKESINNINSDDIVNIIGIVQAIKDGDTTLKNTFHAHKSKKEKVEEKKQSLKKKNTKTELP